PPPPLQRGQSRLSYRPTRRHYLAATQSNAPTNSPVLILPVDAHFYRRGFNPDLTWPNNDEAVERPVESENTEDVPVTIPPLSNEPLRMSLPLCPISVPHLISLPLLLLFGLGLERDVEQLPYRLLPASVVAEFPAPAAMAEIFAKFPEEQFERYYMHIKGFWGNILALGLKNERIVQIVSTAWNVATEARRIRQRQPVAPAQRR
ncbi:hypothetical protein AN958_00536, partial [Leucoagaricus sp. SymC.cos]